jgi:hypothetical protein
MARLGILLCAFLLTGCNSILPGATAPEASAPPQAQAAPGVQAAPGLSDEATGTIVPPPLADLDCAPRAGAITCN